MISVFSRIVLASLLLLSGCAELPSWLNWGGEPNSTQTPGFGKGPLEPPKPAPVPAVQRTVVPPPVVMAAPVPVASKVKVAILLPLSGKDAALGQAMLNAAQQAVFDVAAANFELMPRDTGAGDAAVENATRDAISSGAQLLIGPLFGSNVPLVHGVAQNSSVNILTLSTDTSLAAPGLYVMGFAPGAQVDRIVEFAAQHGLHHFEALVPNTPYGVLVGQAFQAAVARNGGLMIAQEVYDPTKHDSEAHIRLLANKRLQTDVLFLPEGGAELAQIASQLAVAGFDSHAIRLIGTGLWDVPNLGRDIPFVNSGWYVASDANARKNFISTYVSTYGQDPPRLATLAYDATALAAVLAKRGSRFDQVALTNPNGFAGLDGIFRLTPQGLVERGLSVNEVSPDGSKVVDPAPTSFAVTGTTY